jgi:hypothetical protein
MLKAPWLFHGRFLLASQGSASILGSMLYAAQYVWLLGKVLGYLDENLSSEADALGLIYSSIYCHSQTKGLASYPTIPGAGCEASN